MVKSFRTKKEENIVHKWFNSGFDFKTLFNIKILKRSFENIRKEKFLSFSNMFIMIITFLFLGVFIMVVAVSQTAIRSLESQAQVTVFFKDDFAENNIIALRDRYINDKRIDTMNYVSKADAFKIFSEINKDEPVLLESISVGILPASLEIRTKNIKDLTAIQNEFSSIDGVEDIRFFKDVVERFKFWSNIIYVGGFLIIATFVFISYSIILYTLKSTISAKGPELAVLKLVGASDQYVKKPFLYEGVLFGMLSALISGFILILIAVLLNYSGYFTKGIMLGLLYGFNINPVIFAVLVTFLLMLFGVILGYFGSSNAIKKYLKY